MIGYQNPNQGNARRKQLAQFLKGQGQQRAQSANRMRGMNTSAMARRSPGSGNPFFKGSSKASPEKFAFANQKPSLKTLLGLVGKNMGNGGFAGQFFSPDLPVGGLGWGGDVGDSPYTPAPSGPFTGDGSGMGGTYVGTPGEDIYGAAADSFSGLGSQPNVDPAAFNALFGGGVGTSLLAPTSMPGFDPNSFLRSYNGPSQPILGDNIYGLLR